MTTYSSPSTTISGWYCARVSSVCFVFSSSDHVTTDWTRFRTKTRCRIVLIVSEPRCNLEYLALDVVERECCMVISMNHREAEWLKTRIKIPIHYLPQGYTAREDISELREKSSSANGTIEILAPGEDNSFYRRDCIRKLKESGADVDASFRFGKDLDAGCSACKIYLYHPYSVKHDHFAGQRLLWATNKGCCVVGIESQDSEMERFYSGLYVKTTAKELIDTCRELLKGGWKQLGIRHLDNYRRNFDGFKLFENSGILKVLRNV